MRIFATALCLTLAFSAISGQPTQRVSGLPWVAVHDFSVPKDWRAKGRSGWKVAAELENKIVQTGRFKVVTRAKIAKVLKERSIGSSSDLKPSAFGEIVGADYIITGQVDYVGGRITVIGKLIKAKGKDSGKIEKSFDVSGWAPDDKTFSRQFPLLLEDIAAMLAKTPGELLEAGMAEMKQGDFVSAARYLKEMMRQLPEKTKIRALVNAAATRYGHGKVALTLEEQTMLPGALLDHAIELLSEGKNQQAGKIFFVLERSKLGRGVYTLLQLASGKAGKKQAEARKIIYGAKQKYQNAILNYRKKMRASSPEKLCDEAVRELKAFLNDPAQHLSPRTSAETKALIAEIERFRNKLFQGPSTGNLWKLSNLGLEMLPVAKGTFSYQVSLHDDDNETKPRRVTLSRDFWIGRSEVTVGQFIEFLKSADMDTDGRRKIFLEINFNSDDCPILKGGGMKPGKGKTWGDLNRPMVMISWRGAAMFCEWLTRKEKKAGRLPKGYVYRLPTEAEWEYACLAGRKKADPANLDKVAWFRQNSDNRTHVVCAKEANTWGMYDMQGNVWEWCYDWYAERRNTLDAKNPSGPTGSDENGKVIKGGSFVSRAPDLMPLARFYFDYKCGKRNVGFRIVCAPEV